MKQKSVKMMKWKSCFNMMKEKIELLIALNRINKSELARRLKTSPQNMYNKLARDNFTIQDLLDIANATDSELIIKFKTKDGAEI